MISVVIPVYRGAATLPRLMEEIAALTVERTTPDGNSFVVGEVFLVYDNGGDDSPDVIRALASTYDFVRPVWLSKNFGQHAATLAGIASSGGDWVATIDEDGQHDPSDIGSLLDVAMAQGRPLVYAKPTNPPPHGLFRNTTSRTAKQVISRLAGSNAADYQSYRLILGSLARSVAAYAGDGVYLDVAIGWVAPPAATAPVRLREEWGRPSGYTTRRLFAHFLRMVLSSGTRGLRLVTYSGVAVAAVALLASVALLIARISGQVQVEGWTSTMIIVLAGFGAVLIALGVVAEYVGVSVNMAMGKPPYLIVTDPMNGPLGRERQQPLRD